MPIFLQWFGCHAACWALMCGMERMNHLCEKHHSHRFAPIRCKFSFLFVQADNSECGNGSNGRYWAFGICWLHVQLFCHLFWHDACTTHGQTKITNDRKNTIQSQRVSDFSRCSIGNCQSDFRCLALFSLWRWWLMCRFCMHIAHSHIQFENDYWNFLSLRNDCKSATTLHIFIFHLLNWSRCQRCSRRVLCYAMHRIAECSNSEAKCL